MRAIYKRIPHNFALEARRTQCDDIDAMTMRQSAHVPGMWILIRIMFKRKHVRGDDTAMMQSCHTPQPWQVLFSLARLIKVQKYHEFRTYGVSGRMLGIFGSRSARIYYRQWTNSAQNRIYVMRNSNADDEFVSVRLCRNAWMFHRTFPTSINTKYI